MLLLPAPLERFILRDQAEDLLRAPRVVALGPGRVPYGAYARLRSREWLLLSAFVLYIFATAQAVDAAHSRHRAPAEFALHPRRRRLAGAAPAWRKACPLTCA